MDPYVHGKLLMHHRKGNKVGVEDLCDRIPSGGVPEKAPRWDLMRTEACGNEKVFLVCPLVYGQCLGIYGAEIRVWRSPKGPISS